MFSILDTECEPWKPDIFLPCCIPTCWSKVVSQWSPVKGYWMSEWMTWNCLIFIWKCIAHLRIFLIQRTNVHFELLTRKVSRKPIHSLFFPVFASCWQLMREMKVFVFWPFNISFTFPWYEKANTHDQEMNIPGNPWVSRSLPPPPTEALFGSCDFLFLSRLFGRPAYKKKIVLEFMIAFIVFRCPPPPTPFFPKGR